MARCWLQHSEERRVAVDIDGPNDAVDLDIVSLLAQRAAAAGRQHRPPAIIGVGAGSGMHCGLPEGGPGLRPFVGCRREAAIHQNDAQYVHVSKTLLLARVRKAQVKKSPNLRITVGSFWSGRLEGTADGKFSFRDLVVARAHPESQKRDWKVGDVRGIQEIAIS